MISNKKLNPVVTQLFVRGRKPNVSIVFITQLYYKVPKKVRLNTTQFFSMKISNKMEFQQISINHYQILNLKILRKFIKSMLQNYIFFVNDTTLPSYNLLIFRKIY